MEVTLSFKIGHGEKECIFHCTVMQTNIEYVYDDNTWNDDIEVKHNTEIRIDYIKSKSKIPKELMKLHGAQYTIHFTVATNLEDFYSQVYDIVKRDMKIKWNKCFEGR